jgi:phosphatidylserine decarboxylase
MSKSAPIQFYNRLTREIETEAIYGESALRFIYENPLGALALHSVVKKAFFSRLYGRRMDAPTSRALIRPFLEKYNLREEEFADPVEAYQTFNDFFSRRLKPDARPLAGGETTLVLPADGRHRVIPDLSQCRDFMIKGVRFDVTALLADSGHAARYQKGSALISRLCPTDYHRFHVPCTGMMATPRHIQGPLYSVSPIALLRRPSILWENERYVTRLRSDLFGEVAFLEVGATCVGSVIHTAKPNQIVARGAEKGYFRFGGSCVITLFEPGRVRFAEDLLEHSAAEREVYALMGQEAGTA